MSALDELIKQRKDAELKLKLAAKDILVDTFGEDINAKYIKSVVIDVDYQKGGGLKTDAHISLTLNR